MNNNKELVPKIRFKEFTKAWTLRKLSDFGVATGGTSIESEFSDRGVYKVISIGSYSEQSKYNDQNIRAIHSDKTKTRVLNKNDLAMILNDKTSSGKIIGRVLLVDNSGKFVYNQRTERIETDVEKYDACFLYHFLNAPNIRSKIIKQSQGNTQIFVNWTSIQNTDYVVPDKVEQIKLGALFEKIDNLITFYQCKRDMLVRIKSSLLEKMFLKNFSNISEIRFKGFINVWEKCKLQQVGNIVTGTTPSTSDESNYNGDYLFVTPIDINQSRYVEKTNTTLSKKGFESGRILKRGSVLFVSIGSTIGKVAQIKEKATTNQQINAIEVDENFNNNFIYSLLEKNSHDIKAGASTQAVPILNKTSFSSLEFNIPKIDEQEKIGLVFEKIDNLITLYQRKIIKLQNIKKILLERMFV